jgi:hypothetical protein
VRAENPVHDSDQQSCPASHPALMITNHVPAVRLPPDHAARRVAAADPARGDAEDRRDLDPAPPTRRPATATAAPPEAEPSAVSPLITLTGQRQYILAAIHHAGRRARIPGTTAHPTHAWVTQAARNLLMDLQDTGNLAQVRFVVHDLDAKYPARTGEILSSAKITTVLAGARMPRRNSITERWVKTLRAELLDRTLTWNNTCLRHALDAYGRHCNLHRTHHTHRALAAAAPSRGYPTLSKSARSNASPFAGTTVSAE